MTAPASHLPADHPAVRTGGLGVLREGAGLRVLALATDKEGRLFGHSSNPQKEIALDAVSPADLAMVTAVLFT